MLAIKTSLGSPRPFYTSFLVLRASFMRASDRLMAPRVTTALQCVQARELWDGLGPIYGKRDRWA